VSEIDQIGILVQIPLKLPICMLMDIHKILAELRLEHDQLGEAILSLERLASGGAKRRGRPPAWLAKINEEHSPGSAAGIEKQKSRH
jgi:hypothetical protein